MYCANVNVSFMVKDVSVSAKMQKYIMYAKDYMWNHLYVVVRMVDMQEDLLSIIDNSVIYVMKL